MTKKANSYLREFYGPWQKNEPGQGWREHERKRQQFEKLGPPDVRKVAKKPKK